MQNDTNKCKHHTIKQVEQLYVTIYMLNLSKMLEKTGKCCGKVTESSPNIIDSAFYLLELNQYLHSTRLVNGKITDNMYIP